jgi:hypothetical protein
MFPRALSEAEAELLDLSLTFIAGASRDGSTFPNFFASKKVKFSVADNSVWLKC